MAEYFRDLGWSYPQLIACGMDPSLIACSARFLRPAALEDELDVVVATTHLGTTSFALDFMLCCADTDHPVAELAISYVNFDPASHHKRTIPEPIRDRLRQSLARDERKANR
jgi:acyl-CoA thioester hydrolase